MIRCSANNDRLELDWARGGTNAVERFRNEQVLVARNEVARRQAVLEIGGELVRLDFHAINRCCT
jgi:hypothetical protein